MAENKRIKDDLAENIRSFIDLFDEFLVIPMEISPVENIGSVFREDERLFELVLGCVNALLKAGTEPGAGVELE